ncbi:MAG TPA: magnesium transporter [Candidatus Kapabacteria bacterium]|nr:magnesium transporter [Candidatus Kapabacteria bacterium]HOV92108.1 magnesium transporter [Candidatus Kapabacteria bacterium]
MFGQLMQPEILDLIEKRDLPTLKSVLQDWSPIDIADLLNDLPLNERAIIFRILPKEIATDVFEYLDVDSQIDLLKAMANEDVVFILNDMSPDDRTALFEELPPEIAKQLISLLTPQERAIAQKLLGYPENSVGRLMTPDYIAVHPDWTINQVLDYIRKHGKETETFNNIYVIDDKGRLIDDLQLREILLSEPDQKVSDIMDGSYISLNVDDDQEEAFEVFKKYDRIALPVTGSNGVLIGIVTVDDIIDVAIEETTEDIQKIGAVAALEEPYTSTSLFKMVKKRVGWLSVLFIGEMLTATVMGYYENAIAKAVVLALFIPLIVSSGGNSGSQAATLIIRALSLGELSIKDWWFVVRREFLSGLMLGAILAIIGFLRISIWQASSGIYGPYWVLIGLAVSISIVGVVTWGTLVGSLLPLIFKSLGFDPAASSTPFVATLVDVTGVAIYFNTATLFLKGILL